MGRLGPVGALGWLLFLPEPPLWAFTRFRLHAGARVVHGHDAPLDGDGLVVAPARGARPPPGMSSPVPARWPLHEIRAARWMLWPPHADQPTYMVRLERNDGQVLVVVDPPAGLSRRLAARGVLPSSPAGRWLVHTANALWLATCAALAWRFVPWAEFAHLMGGLL